MDTLPFELKKIIYVKKLILEKKEHNKEYSKVINQLNYINNVFHKISNNPSSVWYRAIAFARKYRP